MAQLERFHWIAIVVMVVILLICLVGVGILMSGLTNSSIVYPSVQNACPDYWMTDPTGLLCMIPAVGSKNSIPNTSSLTKTNTPGLQLNAASAPYAINFKDTGWSKGGYTNICRQKLWCVANKVAWDGVDNYNSC